MKKLPIGPFSQIRSHILYIQYIILTQDPTYMFHGDVIGCGTICVFVNYFCKFSKGSCS